MRLIFIIITLLAFNAFGQDTFLGSYITHSSKLSFNELKDKIKEHAKKSNGTLSVGESHLHQKSALEINDLIISEYFNNSQSKVVSCLETLSHFDESIIGKYVFKNSERVKIFKGNSPGRTDFADCFEGENKNYFVYSGFFHQYPFARAFPLEFPKTPVTERNDNNILFQMNKTESLFVTQIELEFLEFTATKALITEFKKTGDIVKFKENARKLILNTELLVMGMEEVIREESVFLSKKAIVLSQDNLEIFIHGSNNYFVVTNFSYRTSDKTLGFLKFLLNLSDSKLLSFKNKVMSSRVFLTTLFQVPNELGELPTSSYGSATYSFKGNTYIIHLINEKESTLFAFSPEDKEPHCLDYDSIQQVDCF